MLGEGGGEDGAAGGSALLFVGELDDELVVGEGENFVGAGVPDEGVGHNAVDVVPTVFYAAHGGGVGQFAVVFEVKAEPGCPVGYVSGFVVVVVFGVLLVAPIQHGVPLSKDLLGIVEFNVGRGVVVVGGIDWGGLDRVFFGAGSEAEAQGHECRKGEDCLFHSVVCYLLDI